MTARGRKGGTSMCGWILEEIVDARKTSCIVRRAHLIIDQRRVVEENQRQHSLEQKHNENQAERGREQAHAA